MSTRIRRPLKSLVLLIGAAGLAGLGLVCASMASGEQVWPWLRAAASEASAVRPPESGALATDDPDTLILPSEVVAKLAIRTSKVEKATQTRPLNLAGSLALDTNRLARVHTRFGGEVVEIGETPEGAGGSAGDKRERAVRVGDKIQKGQLLVAVWSKDLGEKKSELVDALSQLRLDKTRLEKLEVGYQNQAIPEGSVRQAQRDVAVALNAVARAERTLRVWRMSEAEIVAVKGEAARIRSRDGKRDQDMEKEWARVEVRAPFSGVVLERNVAMGDIVDTTIDLFKIADLGRLAVWANAYEDQLPALIGLGQSAPWTVRLKSAPRPPLLGHIDMIGSLVDPTQHTALVRGYVDNPGHRLRAGQFITATVDLPPPAGEVVVPMAALVEDGQESVVIVQSETKGNGYSPRRVKVVRRGQDVAHLQSLLSPEEERQGLKRLKPGELVVVSGALTLKAALENLKAQVETARAKVAPGN